MMTVEANKQLIRDWFDAVNRGDEAAVLAMTAEDFRFETMARAPDWMLYKWDRYQFAAARAAMSSVMKAPIQLSIAGMIGEGDDVAVEAETDSEMLNGRRYNNRYHFVFRLRDGKFCEVREYSCSHLAQNCFNAIEPAEPEKTRMAV
ncbi:MAG TPA: nuclear transport factor 2 family protein [Rhizorhapis sp.]